MTTVTTSTTPRIRNDVRSSRILIAGWPVVVPFPPKPSTNHEKDKRTLEDYESARLKLMLTGRGYAYHKVFLQITFSGRKSVCSVVERTNSVIRLLVESGTIQNDNPETIIGYSTHTRRGPIERVEIKIRNLEKGARRAVPGKPPRECAIDLEGLARDIAELR